MSLFDRLAGLAESEAVDENMDAIGWEMQERGYAAASARKKLKPLWPKLEAAVRSDPKAKKLVGTIKKLVADL